MFIVRFVFLLFVLRCNKVEEGKERGGERGEGKGRGEKGEGKKETGGKNKTN